MNARKQKIVTIIQTRRASSRLPDKVFLPLEGAPLFIRQAQRVQAAAMCGEVVVATTTGAEDDRIWETCKQEGFECFRGHSYDLLDRHYQAACHYGADIVIKIPSDCPLIDPAIIDRVIVFYLDPPDRYDYASNLHPATYPDGNDVEIMSFRALEMAWKNADLPLEREHTTPYIWERPEFFRIGNVIMEGGADYSMSHRFTVDYAEDYEFIRAVYKELYPGDPLFSLGDILSLLGRKTGLNEINKHLAGVNWYGNHLGELKTVSARQTKILEVRE